MLLDVESSQIQLAWGRKGGRGSSDNGQDKLSYGITHINRFATIVVLYSSLASLQPRPLATAVLKLKNAAVSSLSLDALTLQETLQASLCPVVSSICVNLPKATGRTYRIHPNTINLIR